MQDSRHGQGEPAPERAARIYFWIVIAVYGALSIALLTVF